MATRTRGIPLPRLRAAEGLSGVLLMYGEVVLPKLGLFCAKDSRNGLNIDFFWEFGGLRRDRTSNPDSPMGRMLLS